MKHASTFKHFLLSYGGGLRSKNVNPPKDPVKEKTESNRRMYTMREPSLIPAEFVRLDPWEAEYLCMVAERASLGIVEAGRFNGGSVFLMAYANRDVPIYSVDIKPKNDGLLQDILTEAGIGSNVRLIVGDSQKGQYPEISEIDLLFVDGDHSYGGCMADLENWWPKVVIGGHVILHDCYNGSPVMDAVIDFLKTRDVLLMRSPYISHEHWLSPAGSMMHFIKRG